MDSRICVKCGNSYPSSDFYPKQKQCRFCAIEYAKAWQKANPDKVKVIQKKQNKKKWEKNKNDPEYLAKKKLYRQGRRDIMIARAKEWNSKNKKQYYQNIARAKRRRRAKIRNSGFDFYTEQQVLETYGTICYLCDKEIDLSAPRRVGLPGWENGLHIDHVIPISKNGPDTLKNVRPTHGKCNIDKKAFDIL